MRMNDARCPHLELLLLMFRGVAYDTASDDYCCTCCRHMKELLKLKCDNWIVCCKHPLIVTSGGLPCVGHTSARPDITFPVQPQSPASNPNCRIRLVNNHKISFIGLAR